MKKSLISLASKFEAVLSKQAIDALEAYPGEDSSDDSKLEAAQTASLEDLNNIKSTIEMYTSQMRQAQQEIKHQNHLFESAKEIHHLIQDVLKAVDIDYDKLKRQLIDIKTKTKTSARDAGIHISFNELQSLRVLEAMIQDNRAKSEPRLRPPNYSEWVRQRDQDDMEDIGQQLRHRQQMPQTLRSPGNEPPEETTQRYIKY